MFGGSDPDLMSVLLEVIAGGRPLEDVPLEKITNLKGLYINLIKYFEIKYLENVIKSIKIEEPVKIF